MEFEALETGCTVSDVSDLVVVDLDPQVETDSVCSAGPGLLDVAQGLLRYRFWFEFSFLRVGV